MDRGNGGTIFTGWVYDYLKPYARQLQVGNPLMMKAITAAKRKTTRLMPGR